MKAMFHQVSWALLLLSSLPYAGATAGSGSCQSEHGCPINAAILLQGRMRTSKDADKLAHQGRGSEEDKAYHWLEAANNETHHRAEAVSKTANGCPKDTGGTCSWFSCKSWRQATCSSEYKCVCPAGKCAVGGKCVAETQVAQCPKDTGGTCSLFACHDWRSSSCSSGKCVCKPEECAVDGRCVEPMSPPKETPKKVAVVGCGIAGALTALELAHRGVQVEVIDRESDCGVGTSGRIAAEMMFYSYRKAVWKGGWADAYGYAAMAWNMQGSATTGGVAKGTSFASNKKSYEGTKVEVKLKEYKEGQLRFKRANGPPVVSSSSLPDVEAGSILNGISNLPPRDIYEMSKATDTDAQLQKYLKDAPKPVTVEFAKEADPRTNPVYAGGFFEAASDRLRDFFLVQYPELCEAVVSPFCCVQGTPARAWVAANPEKAGYTCQDDPFAAATGSNPGMGVAHALVSEDRVQNIKDHPQQERFDFELWDADQTKERLGDWVPEGTLNGHPVVGGVVNRNDGGFVRTELVFKVIKQILTELGATYKFGQEITAITPSQEGVSLSMRAAGGNWSEVQLEETGPKTYQFTPGEEGSQSQEASTTSYDRVVFATGAAVGPAFDHFDPVVRNAPQLLPAHGYIVLGRGIELSEKHRAIGVVYERAHMYLRTTRSGNPAIGGGMFFNDGSDSDCRALKYRDGLWGSGFNADSYMSQAPLGKRLVEDGNTLKLGGVRPLSIFGNFPLLKSYFGGRVVLNTGGGANGFVCSWKSGQLAADLATSGSPAEPYWTGSFTAI